MKPSTITIPKNAVFVSVTGLTNTTFDPEQAMADRGATEGQLAALNAALAEASEGMEAIMESDDAMLQATWAKLEELTAQIEECCSVDHGEAALDEIWAKLEQLTAQIEECCSVDHGEAALDEIWAKLEQLTAQIEECCNRPCFGEQGEAPSGDNTITVNFEWNGVNQITAGGKATATCSNSERSIRGYWFLIRDANSGMYFRSSSANGGSFTWHIDSAGNVTSSSGGGQVPYAVAIVAVDDANNEGSVSVNLPIEINVVGG